MLYFHSCPHCKTGTVHVDWDAQGSYFECLNCGWMLDVAARESVVAESTEVEAGTGQPAPAVASEAVAKVA